MVSAKQLEGVSTIAEVRRFLYELRKVHAQETAAASGAETKKDQ